MLCFYDSEINSKLQCTYCGNPACLRETWCSAWGNGKVSMDGAIDKGLACISEEAL